MKKSVKKLPHSEVKIEASYTAEEFAPYWDRAKERALSGVRVKGFRPGNAPKELAEAGIDHDKVLKDATEEAVHDALRLIGEEEGFTFLGAPRVEIAEHDKSLAFTIHAAIFPEIRLGDYRKVARRVMQEKREVAVEDKEIEDAVGWLLKSRKQDELSDEFARSFGEFKDAADLKASVREGLMAEKTVHEADRKRAKMTEEIIQASKLDLPEAMTERVIDQMVDELKAVLEAAGANAAGRGRDANGADGRVLRAQERQSEALNFDEYVRKHYTDMAGLRAHLRPRAEANVAGNLVIGKIAEAERLEPTPDEVKEEARRLALQHKNSVDPKRILEYSYGKLQTEKVYKFLESQA